jgi:tetratricopeptide (TPR) repeat protein
MAAVSFTMDDIETSKTLAAVSVTREFDSDKSGSKSKAKAFAKAMGFSGSGPPPADQIVHGLISECVDEFLAKISPHRETVTEKLERGKAPICQTGNKLAKAGEWSEALDCYQQGMQEAATDDGAVFNAGVMYEATGDLAEAESHYDRAVRLNPKEKYILARSRVRRAAGN